MNANDAIEYVRQYPDKTFTRGSVLISKDDPLTVIMAIRYGFIKVTAIGDDGVERLLWIGGRYDFAPVEQLFAKHAKSRFFYTALTDGSYYEIPRQKLVDDAEKIPALMTQIARGMSEHYDDFLERMSAVERSTVKARLLQTLLYLARKLGASEDVDLYAEGLPATHEILATMIGTTRETTSVTMSAIQQEGYVTYSRQKLIVHTTQIETFLEA